MQAWSAQQNEVAIFLAVGPNKVSKGQELWLDYGAVGFPRQSFDVDLDGTYGACIVIQPCCNACSVCLSYIVCRVLTVGRLSNPLWLQDYRKHLFLDEPARVKVILVRTPAKASLNVCNCFLTGSKALQGCPTCPLLD